MGLKTTFNMYMDFHWDPYFLVFIYSRSLNLWESSITCMPMTHIYIHCEYGQSVAVSLLTKCNR